jgi:hypothetical protein
LPGGLLPNRRIDAAISHSASRYGHIHFRQLRALGLSQRAIADRYKAGRLIRVVHEVYAVGHEQRTAIARADAAVMACGVRAALSHDSAAALYGLRKWPRVPELSSAIQHRQPAIRTHRTRTLTRGDVTYRQGIRVTTVARTIADISRRLTDVELVRAIHEARRNGDLNDRGLAPSTRSVRKPPACSIPRTPSRSIFQHTFRAFLELQGHPI